MSFQWLTMRIQEERDRREKEAEINERLPRVLAELQETLKLCVDAYRQAFGAKSAEIAMNAGRISVTVREQLGDQWQACTEVVVEIAPTLPGFRIVSGSENVEIQVGMLPGDSVYYKYGEQYLTMEQLTKLILDRALFPKLGE